MGNFKHLYDVWLQSLAENTRRAYARDIKMLLEWKKVPTEMAFAQLLAELQAAEAHILALEWQNKLVADGLAPSTVNRMVASLKSFVKLLRMNGLVTWAIEIPRRRARSYKDTQGCAAEDVEATIQKVAREDTPIAARDEAILRLIWGLGLRRGEVTRLDLAHVDLRAKKLRILGKGRHEPESLDLTDKLVAALKRWIEHRGKAAGPLFRNFSRAAGAENRLTEQGVWRITKRHGLGRAHGLRHAAITTALEKTGGDVRTVMRFSRHKDLNTLMIYDDNRKKSARNISEALEEGI